MYRGHDRLPVPVEHVADHTENDLVRSGTLVEPVPDAGGKNR
jgi:hypothetical protein